MSNWVSWDELLNQGIKSFEILEYLKEGLQPYSRPDKPIYCPYPYHRYTSLYNKHSRLNNLIIALEGVDSPEKISSEGTEFWLDAYLRKRFEEYNREGAAKDRIQIHDERFDLHGQFANLSKFEHYLENKRKETLKEMEDIVDDDPNLDKDQKKLSWKYFILPTTDEGVESVIDLLKSKGAVFKRDDFLKFENRVSVQSPLQNDLSAKFRKNETPKSSHETFIKNIKIYYENDSKIKIQVPKKKAKTVTCDTLKFKSNRTKAWTALLNILQDPDHIYELGPSRTISADIKTQNKEYQQKRKRLDQISLKLVKYFNKEYLVAIPEKYKLFERAKNMGSGKYRPKFNSATNSDREKSPLETKYERFSKDQLIKEFKCLTKISGEIRWPKIISI
ncbi:MAG: hypothetical protein ACQ9MH_23480 [Nitrospinales bacterium]